MQEQPAINTLVLAHVGDCVYDLFIRQTLAKSISNIKKLNAERVKYVNAKSQAAAFPLIEPHLTPQELTVFKLGRNKSARNVPKAASRAEYNAATGFETLLGWLWMNGGRDRAAQLCQLTIDSRQ